MSKWDNKLILLELKKITDDLGKFPTHQDLQRLKRGDLRNAIILSKIPISNYREQLGITEGQRKRNFWTEEEVYKELKNITDQLGYFPTRRELIDMGRADINMGMWKDGKTIQYWQQLLGYNTKRNENGFWNKEENIVIELKKVADSCGFTPTQQFLRSVGRIDLARAIDRTQKGLAFFQKAAGYEPCSYEASDGHFLDSCYELILDEWLIENNISHLVHGYINGKIGRYKYDFKVDDIYIEIWGYSRTSKDDLAIYYNKKRKTKEKLYKKLNLKLVSIECELFRLKKDKICDTFETIFKKIPQGET